MLLTLRTDLGLETQEGELTYHISEVSLDDGVVPQAHLFLATKRFYSDIQNVTCEIGTFEHLNLLRISGGTKDPYVLYELITSSFSINPDAMNHLLQTLA